MTMVIHKQHLPAAPGVQTQLEMPLHAEVLHVGPDPNGYPCIWYHFDKRKTSVTKRRFVTLFTGQDHEYDVVLLVHHGSYVIGSLVFHTFEITD